MPWRIAALLVLAGIAPAGLPAQQADPGSEPKHVAVEATILTLDHARASRLGLDGIAVSSAGGGHPAAAVRVGTRVGGLDVSAFLDVARRERAVRGESTQKVVTLSGSAAEISSHRTIMGDYGEAASAGPALWVEPIALANGQVRLRVWTAVGEVRRGRFGQVWEEVPVEARAEIVVPSGTPVVIATSDRSFERTDRELLGRGSSAASSRAWVVVRARVVDDLSEAFALPEGIPKEWLKH